ncbi:MAG: hypothetical protein E7317_05420 [Clostridiales bacterium]|nr:hypothetical protein [Clostridiales bacterium]
MNDLNQALDLLLRAHRRYYTIHESAPAPFQAHAEFHMAEEQVFLTRNIKLNEVESSEYVYFALEEMLTPERLTALDEAAWRLGSAHFAPAWGRKGMDVVLVILTNELSAEAAQMIPRLRRSLSAGLSLKGWSNYRLIAMELPSGRVACNRLGRRLEKVLRNSLNTKERTTK